jgi:hypothetical protein
MARTIEFETERIFRRLNVLEGTQIKYAGGQALKRLGYELKHHNEMQMAGRFENPVPYTLSSVGYEANGLELRLYLNKDGSKGNAPATYIYPTDRGSDSSLAYRTRFARGIEKLGITSLFPVPYLGGRGVRRNAAGNMTPGQYSQVLAGLKKRPSVYFSVPDRRNPRSSTLPPGIYQRTSKGVNMLFGYRPSTPSVRQAYDFTGITIRLTQQRLPKLLGEELAKALR